MTVWGIHNDALSADELVSGGFVSIGWDEIGDLTAIGDSQEVMREVVRQAYPESKAGAVPLLAGVLRRFAFVMAPGDLVIAPDRGAHAINIGRVDGDYMFDGAAQTHRHRRPVRWLVTGLPRTSFSPSALKEISAYVTLFEVRKNVPEFLAALRDAGQAVELGDLPGQPDWSLTPGYAAATAATELVGPGRWTTCRDIAAAIGLPARRVEEYLEEMDAGSTNRIVRSDGTVASAEQRKALEAEGVYFDSSGIADPRGRVFEEELRDLLTAADLLPETGRRAWLVRGNNVNGRDLVPGWLQAGRVTLAVSRLRSVTSGITRDELKSIVDDDYAHASYAARTEKVDELHAFLSRMQPGHLVVTTDERRLHIGEIVGDATYEPVAEGGPTLIRTVSWRASTLTVDHLPAELVARLRVARDVLDLTQHLDVIEELVTSGPTASFVRAQLPDATSDLAGRLHVDLVWLQECVDLLNDRPQLIFYGPPGTGKTYIAQALARHVAGENVRLVQFHPAYSYEDFFEGYRPIESGGFELRPGPMRRIVDQAIQSPSVPHVLIIDEINRGNLAKVFGELYFLLEYRAENVELLYGDGDFSLPPNVYLIGTMNTADRSIALVDAAMRRRFAFVPLHPSEPPTSGVLRSWLTANGKPGWAAELLEELNRRIDDPDFKVGPSYLMRDAVFAPGGIERVWRSSILPLLEEHHYGELSGQQVIERYGLASLRARLDRSKPSAPEEAGDAAPRPD